MTLPISITITRDQILPTPHIPWYQHKDDVGVWGKLRTCASGGCPAVMVLRNAPETWFDLHLQMYLVAINMGMSLAAIIALIGDSKAFCNNTGFGDEDNPRANWISRKNLTAPPPRYDKLRTCALNTHSGVEVYSLTFALANILAEAKRAVLRRTSIMNVRRAMASIAQVNALQVETLDGNQPPPMKPGARRPTRVEEINPDDYLVVPWDPRYRHLFIDANNIKAQPGGEYKVGPFDHGLRRPWAGDNEMHSFLPLVSTASRVLSPLTNWRKIPAGSPFPSPFRRL